MRGILFGCWYLALTAPLVLAAPPQVNYLFPPGAQRGQTVSVTAKGSWDRWPVTVWIDRPGVSFVADAETKGQFQVTVDSDAPPGIYWLRAWNSDGASNPKPFVIGTLSEMDEQEPNDQPSKPQRLEHSTLVNGRLGKRGDVDTFAFPLQKGQTLVASLQANEILGSEVDAVLQICSPRRFVLDQTDDTRGLDPQLVFTAPADGDYLVRVFGFPSTPNSSINFAGDDSYLYRLTLTTSGFVDHALPMSVQSGSSSEVELRGWNIDESAQRVTIAADAIGEAVAFGPNLAGSVRLAAVPHPTMVARQDSGPDQPQPIAVPSTVTGVIEIPRDEDVFAFQATKGTALELQVAADQLGFLLDAALVVTDAAGKVLAEADDSRRARDPQLNFTPGSDGEFHVGIRDVHGHGGLRYVYLLTVRESRPGYELKLSANAFTVKRGEKVEVSVSVERDKGFEEAVEVVATKLPPGITCEPIRSESKGDSSKKITLVLQASERAEPGAFQVVGKSTGERPLERVAVAEGDGVPETWNEMWVTVTR